MKLRQSTDAPNQLEVQLNVEAKLMKAALQFQRAFNENLSWGDSIKRLDYTLHSWRELAIAAIEFAESKQPEEKGTK